MTAVVSTVSAGGANKVQGPGMVYNLNGAQVFILYDSFGNQINSGDFQNGFAVAGTSGNMYVPGNMYVASSSYAFTWVSYT